MKISLEWLGQYLSPVPSPEEAAERLTFAGLPVEVIEKVGDDTVIDVEVTSNRGDCLSHWGVARELAALTKGKLIPVDVSDTSPPLKLTVPLDVSIEASEHCPHYTARAIRGVKIGPSPAWLQRRLLAVGITPINNVVDVTNYVMFELGQPLHVFDYDTLDGAKVVVRTARPGEKLVSLDGHERTLEPWMLVIADASKPAALAGVMGGRDSGVTAGTTTVLLESARFDPLVVRKTARALAMKSDSSYRFERSIDPHSPERASARATQLILELAGGDVASTLTSAGSSGYVPKKLDLRPQKLKQVLGIDLPTEDVVDALARLNLQPVPGKVPFEVTVPSYRLDLNLEVDLVEEVARIVGYDRIPQRDEISIRLSQKSSEETTTDLIRSILVAAGHFEAVTFSFVTDALVSDFLPAGGGTLIRASPQVRKSDANLRPSVLPGLLEAVRRNETGGVSGAMLFEIGSHFWRDAGGNIDERRAVSWVGSKNLREGRGTVEMLLGRLDAGRAVTVVPDARAGFATGVAGRVEWGGTPIGYVGRVSNAVAKKLGLRDLPCMVELELKPLLDGARHVPQLNPLPKFPAVRRDLSLVVPEPTRFEQIDQVVRGTQPVDLENVEFVTVYRGKPLETGQKSITITLVFRSVDTTLTGEQVEGAVRKIVDASTAQLGAMLRV